MTAVRFQTVTVRPANPVYPDECWCHICHTRRPPLLMEGFRRTGGYTYLCQSCAEDLGLLLPAPPECQCEPSCDAECAGECGCGVCRERAKGC